MSRAAGIGLALLVSVILGGCDDEDGDSYLNAPLLADLVVADIIDKGPTSETLDLEVQVSNEGTIASPATDLLVEYRVSGDVTWLPLGTFPVDSLEYAQIEPIAVSKGSLANASYDVRCTVDPDGEVEEDFTDNNVRTETVFVTKPSLKVAN